MFLCSRNVSGTKTLTPQSDLRQYSLYSYGIFVDYYCHVLLALHIALLSYEEKNELLILQKERLNVALQNSPDLKQEINYWYALHCFLKNEKENARFFLKKTIKNKKQIENISWLLDDSKNWLKNKLPSDFLSFVKNIYEQETIGYNVKEQTPILSKI